MSLTLSKGSIVALLGGNGAGKTEKIDNLNPSDLVKSGVIQVMEGRHCFEHLTVEENLLTGAYTRKEGKKGT